MNKKVLFGRKARNKMFIGVEKATDAVKVTLGPEGRNVLYAGSYQADYGTHSYPLEVTKDGFRVTQRFDLEDFFERAGSNFVKECAYKTVMQAGDGTTSTVVLMHHLVKRGMKAIRWGANPMKLKRDIDVGVSRVVSVLKTRAIQIGEDHERIEQIANISANNDPEIGGMVASAFKKIGHEGSIDIEAGKSVVTEVKVAKGYRLDSGWMLPQFVNKRERGTVEFEEPMILLYNKVITHHKQIEKMIALVLAAKRPLVIVCAGAQDEGLMYLALNNQPRTDNNGQYIEAPIKCCIVKAPPSMDQMEMEDLAILTGGSFMADNRGADIKEMKMTDFGTCRRVVVTKDETIFIEGRSKETQLENLLTELRIQRKDAKNEDEAAPIEKRIAKLTGGIAVIHVGAATETEMKEKMDRFDDSVRAVKSAIAEGYIAGAGTAYLRIRSGNKIVDSALDMILKQICHNVGLPPREWWEFWRKKGIFEQVRDATGNVGYNAKTGKAEDLIEAGVIDPVKVLRCALQNAASSATMMLTTECSIVDCY